MKKQGKVIASIEARMGSSRLPGKVLKLLSGRPLLEVMIERVRQAKLVDEVVIATSDSPKDDPLAQLAKRLNIACFRGSEDDVLARVVGAVKSVKGDHVVELWGDTPLIDPQIIDEAVKLYLEGEADSVATFLEKTFPWGMALIVFPFKAIEDIERKSKDPVDRENVSNYIYEHPEEYKVANLPCPAHLHRPDIRLTVDEQPDLDFVTKIYETLSVKNPRFSTKDIIALLDKNPEWLAINQAVRQKKLRANVS